MNPEISWLASDVNYCIECGTKYVFDYSIGRWIHARWSWCAMSGKEYIPIGRAEFIGIPYRGPVSDYVRWHQ